MSIHERHSWGFSVFSTHSSPYSETPRTKPLICGLNTAAKIIHGEVLLDIRVVLGVDFQAPPQPSVARSPVAWWAGVGSRRRNAGSFSGEMVLQQLQLSNLPPGAQGNLMIAADN